MTSRFVGLPCWLTIICDNAFLPTPAKYECQAPKICNWVPRDQLCQGLRRSAGSGGEDPENQVGIFTVYNKTDNKEILTTLPLPTNGQSKKENLNQYKYISIAINNFELEW